MWVCSELGLVNLLSQTLHLCFFCVLDVILELKVVMSAPWTGTGCRPEPGLGRVGRGASGVKPAESE